MSFGAGWPSASVTRVHSSKTEATKAAPDDVAAISPAGARVSAAIVATTTKANWFAHRSPTIFSLIVLAAIPAARERWNASQREEGSHVSSAKDICSGPPARGVVSPSGY